MQQQINLLSPALMPQKVQVTLGQVVRACAAVSVLLLSWSAWQGFELYQGRIELTKLKGDVSSIVRVNEDLRAAVQREADPSLSQQVALLRIRKREEAQLRSVLLDLDHARGFSGYLRELSLVQVDGLWLQELGFYQGGKSIALKGFAQQPNLVPEFLQRLAAGDGFRGRTFDTFELSEATSGNVAFAITGPGESEQGG